MKNYRIFILMAFAITLTAVACTDPEVITGFEYGEIIDLAFEEEQTSVDGEVAVTLTEVVDSRCPVDVICVWEGEATVKLDVVIAGGAAQVVELTTITDSHPDLYRDTLDNYIFILGSVTPYPQTIEGVPQADYVIELTVEEL